MCNLATTNKLLQSVTRLFSFRKGLLPIPEEIPTLLRVLRRSPQFLRDYFHFHLFQSTIQYHRTVRCHRIEHNLLSTSLNEQSKLQRINRTQESKQAFERGVKIFRNVETLHYFEWVSQNNKHGLEIRWICWKGNLLAALCCLQPGVPVVCWVVEEDSRCRSQPKSRGFTSGWEGVLPEYRQEQGNLMWIYLTRPPASSTEFIFNEVLPLHRF